MSSAFDGLEPIHLWNYFKMVSQIPRSSGHEERIQGSLKKLGKEKGLDVREDKVGNLVLVVPPTSGCEAAPSVALQAHVDMVCEKNKDVDHDFLTQGIDVVRDGDWLTAHGTTLGADNGIGVAAALALVDDPPKRHGRLELLFTVDEERGLTGAAGIEPHMLGSKLLLNLDSEEEGYVTVGCAGGGDTIFELACEREPLGNGWETAQIAVRGLQGGHSGMDIIHNRANSLRCLGRCLDAVKREAGGLRLFWASGGSKRNAIPREATAVVSLPSGTREVVAGVCDATQKELLSEFGATEPDLRVLFGEPDSGYPKQPLSENATQRFLVLLQVTPTGLLTMHRSMARLVETSTNLGVLEMDDDTARFVSCSRSSVGAALRGVRQGLRALAESQGANVRLEASYPGWDPDLDSHLLEVYRRVYDEVAGREPEVIAVHAGLECGIIGERFPGMDMISFGPEMTGVHAPGERVSISSTQRFYTVLKALLTALAA